MMMRSDARKMYSWWWDSHISPKNSKWLQENLTDMDTKVKLMIKLIEVDEDSFARRAEMYYKKRPELMKLVEDFYRAYRALAERYDHATGFIKQAQHTMAQVFPDRIPFSNSDDGSGHDSDPETPKMLSFEADDLLPLGPYSGKNGILSEDFESAGRKGLKQHGNLFGVDVPAMKEALAKLEAEKLATLFEHRRSLQRLSNLESEVSRVQEESNAFSERASKAEAEVSTLKEALAKLEAEREASLLQYQQCLDRVSDLEATLSRAHKDTAELNDRACKAESKVVDLREELDCLKDEKEANLVKFMQALEKIANLENKLQLAEHDATVASERADKAEKQVETLTAAIAKLKEEKDAIALQHQLCLEKIASLEHELSLSHETAENLKCEVDEGLAKLKGAEEQCLVLESSNKSVRLELDSLLVKVESQSEELSEKQKELGKLWACVQEERQRFSETETAFQELQNLHSQAQGELRSAAAELQKRVQLLKDKEEQNQQLSSDIGNLTEENKSLNEAKLSSALSIKTMQEEILNLKGEKEKLQDELELRLGERNALQLEIHSLKEEINDLSKKHGAVLDQVGSVGLNSESFASSVRELKDENTKLKGSCQRNEVEIAALVEKLAVMENLIEKNTSLENSLSNLRAELEEAREKVAALEDSFTLLMGEKSAVLAEKETLISQLAVTTENLEKLSERNTYLENSLSNANVELEALRAKSRNLEESCRLLNDEKSVLLSEKQALSLQLETSHGSLKELRKSHAELEQKCSLLEEQREVALQMVEELRASLDTKQREHSNSTRLSQMQISNLEKRVLSLQEAGERTRNELEAELDKVVSAQFEIFILRKYVKDLKERNSALLTKFEKVLEAFGLSEKLISGLQRENLEQQLKIRLLTEQIKRLRMGMSQLCKALEADAGLECDDITYRDQMVLQNILSKLDDTKRSLSKAWDENHTLVVEKSVLLALLEQLRHEVADWKAAVNTLCLELKFGNEKLAFLQEDMQKLLESNKELISRVCEGNRREELHAAEIEILRGSLVNIQAAYHNLERDNRLILKDKGMLLDKVAHLEQKKHKLERENSNLFCETIALDSLAVILRNIISENLSEKKELADNMDQLYITNMALDSKVRSTEGKLEQVHNEKTSLEVSLIGTENELRDAIAAKSQKEAELEIAKSELNKKDRELSDAEAAIDSQSKQIIELSQSIDQQVRECRLLQESIQGLEIGITRMNKQHEEEKETIEALSAELKKGREEVEHWETMAGALLSELQCCSIRELLYKEKLFELNKSYESLADEDHLKSVEVIKLREKVQNLEGESLQTKARWDAYSSAAESMRESLASLETHTLPTQIGNDEENDARSFQMDDEVETSPEHEKIADLMDVQKRIIAIEKVVIEMKRIAEDSSNSAIKLEAAMKQIEALKAQNSSRRANSRSSRHLRSREEPSYGTSDELRMKDIMLDQASKPSVYGGHVRESSTTDDDILELWETLEKAGNKELRKSGRPSLESLVEKEMCIDEKQDKRLSDPIQDESRKQIMERLDSDLKNLNDLQTTVQDLEKKLLRVMEYSGQGEGSEYDSAKEQLMEAENAILKLQDINRRLSKKARMNSSSFDSLPTVESSEGKGSSRRSKVWEQARKCSERIGKLELEVLKMQFLVLNLGGDNKASKGGSKPATDWEFRVTLRDYLYGGLKDPRRRKKAARFCACVLGD